MPELRGGVHDELQAEGCVPLAASGHAGHSRLDLQTVGEVTDLCGRTSHAAHLKLLHPGLSYGESVSVRKRM